MTDLFSVLMVALVFCNMLLLLTLYYWRKYFLLHKVSLEKYQGLSKEFAIVNTRLEERELSHQQQQEALSIQHRVLKKEFEHLANNVFEHKQQHFRQSSQQSIEGLLKPFRAQIDAFQQRVNQVHDVQVQQHGHLQSDIQKVFNAASAMQSQAASLSSVLKGDSQKRGAWGEAQLQRSLEMSGLLENIHFTKQQSFKDAIGKVKQTDFVVELPDKKHIVIDSKVTLNAFSDFVQAINEKDADLALQRHIKAVKRHVDELSQKDYSNLVGIDSPSFVLMFMPIEPAYIETLKYQKEDLFSYAYNKSIILVSHATLAPILTTVANLWMLERGNQEARQVADKAADIYNQMCVIAERLGKLGSALTSTTKHYNQTVTALVGQQGLHNKVESFKQLSNKVNKQMTEVQTQDVIAEHERLNSEKVQIDKKNQECG